jgi:Protein of unknown function (DUF2721)
LRTDDGEIARVDELTGAYAKERLKELDTQLPRLLQRYQHVRNAVLTMYCAVLVFVATMFTISVAYALQSTGWAIAALVLFLVGLVTALAALVLHALYVLGGNVVGCTRPNAFSTWAAEPAPKRASTMSASSSSSLT